MVADESPDLVSSHTFDKDSCPFRDCHRDVSCPNGFRLDKSGCPTCECQKCQSRLNCKLSCVRGFKVDRSGCSICECRKDGEEPDLTNNNVIPASSSSSWSRPGNKGSPAERQQGKEIPSSLSTSDQSSSSPYFPSMKVDQRNLLGNPGGGNSNKDFIGHDGQHQFEYHHVGNRYDNRPHQRQHPNHGNTEEDDGDQLEDHNDGLYGYGYGNSNEARGTGSSSSSVKSHSSPGTISGGSKRGGSRDASGVLVLFCALDSDGVRRMEGEEWSDHCRRCVCRNGKEMCSLITCQAPKCEHPIFYPGDCCPRCPGLY